MTEGVNPVLAEWTRGGPGRGGAGGPLVERAHRGAVAVADPTGALVWALGDVGRPVLPRSAIKLLQALPLVESGAADARRLDSRRLALACASHQGSAAHAGAVAAWLADLGLGEPCLMCGAQVPSDAPTRAALKAAGEKPSQLHNNCSGKHAGFVTLALHLGAGPEGYVEIDHPVQKAAAEAFAEATGQDGPLAWGVDGCSAPNFAALMLQYVNPMAINTWALTARYPDIRAVGLCHSVQGTAAELARDLGIDAGRMRYRAAGINHMSFFLRLEEALEDGTCRDLYPLLREGYRAGRIPLESAWNPRCPNLVRYEAMMRLGFFVTESSEHFAEYVPWFIRRDRPDLIERFRIPLDEYPARCEEQAAAWAAQAEALRAAERIEVAPSHEYAATIMEAVVTGEPAVIYGNVANRGFIPQLPEGAAVEVPCLVDANGVQPTAVRDIPPQLVALMRTNLNVQELTVQALLTENPAHIRHAAMLDPHTAAELDLDRIHALVDALVAAHGEWLPPWARASEGTAR